MSSPVPVTGVANASGSVTGNSSTGAVVPPLFSSSVPVGGVTSPAALNETTFEIYYDYEILVIPVSSIGPTSTSSAGSSPVQFTHVEVQRNRKPKLFVE